MRSVFIVHHVHLLPSGEEDFKLVGVFTSADNARAAIRRLSQKPGFIESPSGFNVDEYKLDCDYWTEGFVTLDG